MGQVKEAFLNNISNREPLDKKPVLKPTEEQALLEYPEDAYEGLEDDMTSETMAEMDEYYNDQEQDR
jgi:hypothetical protein